VEISGTGGKCRKARFGVLFLRVASQRKGFLDRHPNGPKSRGARGRRHLLGTRSPSARKSTHHENGEDLKTKRYSGSSVFC